VDLKRRDALALVQSLADRVTGKQAWLARVPTQINKTLYLHLHQRAYIGSSVEGHYILDSVVLSLQKLLSPSFPLLFQEVALRCLAIDEALDQGIAAGDSDTLVAAFFRHRNLQTLAESEAWLRERHLSYDEIAISLRERDLETQLLKRYSEHYPELQAHPALRNRVLADVAARTGLSEYQLTHPPFMRPGIPWEQPLLRELKLSGKFQAGLELARDVLQINSQFAEGVPGFSSALSPERLEQWFSSRWGIEAAEFDSTLLDRGFTSYHEFIETARLAYAYERTR